MTSISHSQRYLPHELTTKYYATKLYRSGYSISFVCRRYKNIGYSRHAASLFRVLRKMGFYVDKEKHTKYVPKPYDTPTNIGIKWQLDVKYVPKEW